MIENLEKVLEEAFNHGRQFFGIGELPDYIPELHNVKPDNLSITAKTIGGRMFNYSTEKVHFTIQSMVKVMVLICALEEYGEYRVFRNVGLKPSSQPFNSVVGLELSERIPVNPFINAGAIVLVNLLGKDSFTKVLNKIKLLSGRSDVTYSKEVFTSEFETGEINRALTYMMKAGGILKASVNVERLLENYFRLCSILVTTEDLASIGAVLANGGKDIKTGETVVDPRIVHIVITLMSTCGMYDYSGEFAMSAGIPAKSGVSGGILSLSYGDMGLSAYCPRLDSHGNSVAAIKVLSYIANKLKLSIFEKNCR